MAPTLHELRDAGTGEVIALANTEGFDFEQILAYGRRVGNPALAPDDFSRTGPDAEGAGLPLAGKEGSFYELSYRSGATRADSWIDIEGGIGNLFANASLQRKFPDKPFYVEGEPVGLSRAAPSWPSTCVAPTEGVAVHINAYNFPIWGPAGEDCRQPAGRHARRGEASPCPLVPTSPRPWCVKSSPPASRSAGALRLVLGLGPGIPGTTAPHQDVVTFTGSAATGAKLRAHPRIISEAVPFTHGGRPRSNAAVLGPDAPARHAGAGPVCEGSAQGNDGQVRAEVHRHPPRHRTGRFARRRANCLR
ncbi:MAG: hypothetical protein WKG07_04345 [Hymenobacter sp.]